MGLRMGLRLRRCENGNVIVNVSCLVVTRVGRAPPSLKDSDCKVCESNVVDGGNSPSSCRQQVRHL
jgi:hypothetical protein